MENDLPLWISASATSLIALGGLLAVVRKPFSRLHDRFDAIEQQLGNINHTLVSVRQAQEVMATLIKPLLPQESAEVMGKIIDFQRYAQKKADSE